MVASVYRDSIIGLGTPLLKPMLHLCYECHQISYRPEVKDRLVVRGLYYLSRLEQVSVSVQ